MLSILIPTYNYNSGSLVTTLHDQAELLTVPYEIIIADDASTESTDWMQSIIDFTHIRCINLKHNIGRSAIRNLLAHEAHYPYLLFIDGDAKVFSPLYLQNYIDHLKPHSVIIGGTAYDAAHCEQSYSLRILYGRKREACDAYHQYFTTFNFVIDKSLFSKIKFEERLTGYGHEDTLFGLALKQANINIEYIPNPLYHEGLDDNRTFLDKTEHANLNLFQLYQSGEYNELIKYSKLLRLYQFLETRHLVALVGHLFSLVEVSLRKNLLSSRPNLTVFDFYKIGHLCKHICRKMSK